MHVPSLTPHELLQELLGDCSPERFAQAHWDQKPLFVKGDPSKFERLVGFSLDPQGWGTLTEALEAQERDILAVYRSRKADYDGLFLEHRDHGTYLEQPSQARPTRYMSREEIPASLSAGHSVQINGLENLVFGSEPVSRWARFADRVKAGLHFPGEFYLGATRSPQGARFHSHYDPGPGFILQTHGRKRYTIGREPLVPWPNRKGYRRADGSFKYAGRLEEPAKAAWEEERDPSLDPFVIEMEPGDMIYLPSGVLHETEALEESIAILMLPPSVRFLAVLGELLDGALGEREIWRRSPVWVGEDPVDGGPSPEWLAFNREAISAVRKVLDSVSPEGYELSSAWKALAGRSLVSQKLDPALPPADPLKPTDRLRVNPAIPFLVAAGCDRHGKARATVYFGTRKMDVHGPWVSLFQRIPRDHEFKAEEAQTWRGRFRAFDWEGTRTCLEALKAEGLLVPA